MLNTNVYGGGSFYASDSCGSVFYFDPSDSISGKTFIIEWDICEHESNTTINGSVFGGTDISLKGKRSIYSETNSAVLVNTYDSTLSIDCNTIETNASGVGAIVIGASTGNTNNCLVNANQIISPSGSRSVLVTNHTSGNTTTINANFVEEITTAGAGFISLKVNGGRVNKINFQGTYLNANTHVGWYRHTSGIADIKLIDRCWGAGLGTINATFNSEFDYTSDNQGSNLISSMAGNIVCNYRLQNKTYGAPYTINYVNNWFFSNAGNTINLLGQWDVQNFWYTHASGVLNIASDTIVNIGPIRDADALGVSNTETFNLSNVRTIIKGTIIERCPTGAVCDVSQSAQTYSNTIMRTNPSNGAQGFSNSRVTYNGATIIVRNQNSQIITTSTTGGTIGIYSGGLNTNKINSLQAEKHKVRISVTGTSASYTVNGETFTSTTGTTAAESAAELVTLTNNSGTLDATASQDTPGTDEYIYVESDIAGEELTLSYNTATELDVVIRANTKGVTDNVGGTLIEDENIINDIYY
jgi:hypothetical protein